MIRILLVEDYEELRTELTEVLTDESYKVFPANTFVSALHIFRKEQIDLCILDIRLPDGNGYSLCKKIRTISDVPIIFLTALNKEEQIIHGLEIGADDYLSKPFRLGEFLARIRVQLKKHNIQELKSIIHSGTLTFNIQNYTVERNDQELNLSPIEFLLCIELLNAKGALVNRIQLLQLISDKTGSFPEDNTLTVYFSRIKKKIGTFKNCEYIETVRGYGYRWSIAIYDKERRYYEVER